MSITIYKPDETDFTHNGLGLLDNRLIDIEVFEEFNGEYTASFTYPLGGKLSSYIIGDALIKCFTPNGLQLFRVKELNPSMGIINVKAYHIFYDLLDNMVMDIYPYNMNGQQALNTILNGMVTPHNFTASSDIGSSSSDGSDSSDENASARIIRKNGVDAIMGDSKNTFISRWGGELLRDNFNIIINKAIGADYGVQIRHKKNLVGYQGQIDYSSVVTRILPQGFDGIFLVDTPAQNINGAFVNSPLINNYINPIHRVFKYEDIKAFGTPNVQDDDPDAVTLTQARAMLLQRAEDEYSINKVDIPTASYSVSFVDLRDTIEYKDFQVLENIGIWDYVTVIHEEDNFEINARMRSYTYNPILQSYNQITLETELNNFTGSFINDNNNLNNIINDLGDNLNHTLQTADGKNTIYYGNNVPENPRENDLWYKMNGELFEMWRFDGTNWTLAVGDMTGELISAQVNNILNDLDILQDDLDTNTQNIEDLQNDLADNQEALDNLSNELGITNSNLEDLQDDLDITNDNLDDLKEALDATNSNLANAQSQVDDVQDIMEDWSWGDTVEIDGGKIRAGTITAREILAGSITALQIATGTITSNEIETGTITANEIATGTITALQIASGTITANEIKTGTITANELGANSVTATQLSANSITASNIVSGSITADCLSANSVNASTALFGTLDASKINVINLNASNISTGALSAINIAGSAITGSTFQTTGQSEAVGNDVSTFQQLTLTAGRMDSSARNSNGTGSVTRRVSYNSRGTVMFDPHSSGALVGEFVRLRDANDETQVNGIAMGANGSYYAQISARSSTSSAYGARVRCFGNENRTLVYYLSIQSSASFEVTDIFGDVTFTGEGRVNYNKPLAVRDIFTNNYITDSKISLVALDNGNGLGTLICNDSSNPTNGIFISDNDLQILRNGVWLNV